MGNVVSFDKYRDLPVIDIGDEDAFLILLSSMHIDGDLRYSDDEKSLTCDLQPAKLANNTIKNTVTAWMTQFEGRKFASCTSIAATIFDVYGEQMTICAALVKSWLPMDVAPKDGEAVLVYRYTWIRPRIGRWSHGCWWTDSQPLNGDPDVWLPLQKHPEGEECTSCGGWVEPWEVCFDCADVVRTQRECILCGNTAWFDMEDRQPVCAHCCSDSLHELDSINRDEGDPPHSS